MSGALLGDRVAVIGCGGAGKSRLALALGRRLDLPVVHLDEHYWRPGWQPTDPSAWRALQERLVSRHSWVIDGNYLSTIDLRLGAADTVVFLDLSRALRLAGHGPRVDRAGAAQHGSWVPRATGSAAAPAIPPLHLALSPARATAASRATRRARREHRDPATEYSVAGPSVRSAAGQ